MHQGEDIFFVVEVKSGEEVQRIMVLCQIMETLPVFQMRRKRSRRVWPSPGFPHSAKNLGSRFGACKSLLFSIQHMPITRVKSLPGPSPSASSWCAPIFRRRSCFNPLLKTLRRQGGSGPRTHRVMWSWSTSTRSPGSPAPP